MSFDLHDDVDLMKDSKADKRPCLYDADMVTSFGVPSFGLSLYSFTMVTQQLV